MQKTNHNFPKVVADFAESIREFHQRFGCEFGSENSRLAMLHEEFNEHSLEVGIDESKALHELADLAFVALGTLELAGEAGIDALRVVAAKNGAKTSETHERNESTGKIQRRRGAKGHGGGL